MHKVRAFLLRNFPQKSTLALDFKDADAFVIVGLTLYKKQRKKKHDDDDDEHRNRSSSVFECEHCCSKCTVIGLLGVHLSIASLRFARVLATPTERRKTTENERASGGVALRTVTVSLRGDGNDGGVSKGSRGRRDDFGKEFDSSRTESENVGGFEQ